MENLRPFHLTGPFISMIDYVLTAIRPFIVLGALVIVTFGMAFRVLFADSADEGSEGGSPDEDSRQSFSTLWLAFEYMFHAILGQFDPEVGQRKMFFRRLRVEFRFSTHRLPPCFLFGELFFSTCFCFWSP